MENASSDNVFTNFATVLSLLLPIVQVFAGLLPAQAKKLILFSNEFFVISILAAIVAYLLIVSFKSTLWFAFTFQRKKKQEHDKQQFKINANAYQPGEFWELVRSDKLASAPYYITPLNVYYLLLPATLILLILFIALGIFNSGTTSQPLIFSQAVIYILLVGLTSLTLGVLYINDVNRNRRDDIERKSWQNLCALLFKQQALPEFPRLDFIAEVPTNAGGQSRKRYIITVNKQNYYAIETDLQCTKLFEINEYRPDDRSIHPIGESN